METIEPTSCSCDSENTSTVLWVQFSYCKLCDSLDLWGKNWIIFQYFGAVGFEMQRHIFGMMVLHLDSTPNCMHLCWKKGDKSNLEKFFFFPNCAFFLPVSVDWFVFMTQMSPKQVPTGQKRKLSEGSCFSSEFNPTPNSSRQDLDTSCHGKLVFQKHLKEEFILSSKINPRTCHTISTWCAVLVADCKEQADTFKMFSLSESFTLVLAIVVISRL